MSQVSPITRDVSYVDLSLVAWFFLLVLCVFYRTPHVVLRFVRCRSTLRRLEERVVLEDQGLVSARTRLTRNRTHTFNTHTRTSRAGGRTRVCVPVCATLFTRQKTRFLLTKVVIVTVVSGTKRGGNTVKEPSCSIYDLEPSEETKYLF